MMDEMKQKLSKGVIVLGAAADGKVMLVSGVTEDLKSGNYHAGKIVNHVAITMRWKRRRSSGYGNGWCERCCLNLMMHFNPCMIMSNLFNW